MIIFIITSLCLDAQDLSEYNFNYPYYGDLHGMATDSLGFIWVINDENIAKYDGRIFHEFPVYDKDQIEFHQNNYSKSEIYFSKDNLIFNSRKEIAKFNIRTVVKTVKWQAPEGTTISFLKQDELNQFWIFTDNKASGSKAVFHAEKNFEFEYAWDLAHAITDQPTDWSIETIEVFDKEFIVIGQFDGAVIVNKYGVKQKNSKCYVFRIDNLKRLWRLDRDTFEVFNPLNDQFELHPVSGHLGNRSECSPSTVNFNIEQIHQDKFGDVWFGGQGSHLFKFSNKRNAIISFRTELISSLGGSGGSVYELVEDSFGNLYGTKRGGMFAISRKNEFFDSYALNMIQPNHPLYEQMPSAVLANARGFFTESFLSNASINSITEDSKGGVYFQEFRFTYKLDLTKNIKVLPIPVLEDEKLKLFCIDDNLLYCSWHNYYSVDPEFQLEKKETTINSLQYIFQQSNGTLWATGRKDRSNQFLGILNPVSYELEEILADKKGILNFSRSYVYSIQEDSKNQLWLTTNSGIYQFDRAKGIQRKLSDQFILGGDTITIGRIVRNSHIIDQNRLWYTNPTAVGLIDLEKETLLQHFDLESQGLRVKIYDFVTLGDSAVWLGCNQGLGYYNFRSTNFIWTEDIEGDGIASNIRKMKHLSDGRIAIGTDNGFHLFDPTNFLAKYRQRNEVNKKVKLALNYYSILNGKTNTQVIKHISDTLIDEIDLAYNDQMLTFNFSLLNFTSSKDHLFSFQLDGYDAEWSTPNNSTFARYTSLPPGNYQFRVKGNLGDGIWTDHILSIPVTVRQVWYKKAWFILLSISMLGMIIFLLIRNYLRQEKSRLKLIQKETEAEQLKEMDEMKSQLYTNITHEFRTPLTVIMGMNENIQGHKNEKKLIRRNSENLLRLINQLLDLSKLDSATIKLDKKPGDIAHFLQYLTESFLSMATDKGIRLTYFSEEESLWAYYDEVKVQHIIYNLLSNAIKFTEDGGKIILHLVKIEKEGKPYIKINVKDTGVGIPEDKIPFIFDRFFQVDNTSTREGEGTGIGLALVYEMVKLMDGEIQVNSQLGKGTSFLIWLPFHEIAPEEQIQSTDSIKGKATPIAQAILGKEKGILAVAKKDAPLILVIEDNADVVEYIETILQEQYQIATAKNGKLGVDQAIKLIPDIIISDVMMPIMNGYAVCETLKQDQRTSHIPIILLTAKSTQDDKIEGLRYGADAYLTKPFNREELFIRLEKLIELRTRIQKRYQTPLEPISDSFPASIEDAFLKKIHDYLERHQETDFSIPDLAKGLQMSRSQVYRKVKAITGKSITQYIRFIRLTKAKSLVETSDKSISEIAYECGFSDPSYFTRAFISEFGKSPKVFRKTPDPTN